jgi:exopolysaccharide production protein ExoQ
MSSEVFAHGRSTKWMPRSPYRSWAPVVTNLPIWRRAIGWILLPPMLYLANGGYIPAGAGVASTTEAGSGSSPLHKIMVVLLNLIFLAVISTSKAPLLRSLVRSKLVLSLPLLAICSSVWSEQPSQSLISGAILLVFTVFTICIAADCEFQRQVELIIMVGSMVLPLSIALALLAPSIGGSSAGWTGAFGHKQNCAAVSTLWLITALHWMPRGLHRQFVKWLYIGMCAVLIVMSNSRTGWLLACAALLFWSVLWAAQHVRRLEIILGLAVSVPVSLMTAYTVVTHFGDLAGSLGKDATLSQRTVIWAAVWDSIAQRPYLGYGASAFWTGLNGPSQRVVLVTDWGIQQAQNGYLDLWLTLGIGGVLIIALMGAVAVRRSLERVSLESMAHRRWCTVIIILALLYNTGESCFGVLQMGWFMFLLAYMGLQSLGCESKQLAAYASANSSNHSATFQLFPARLKVFGRIADTNSAD